MASAAGTEAEAWISQSKAATVARVRRVGVVETGSVEAWARSLPEGVARKAVERQGVKEEERKDTSRLVSSRGGRGGIGGGAAGGWRDGIWTRR